MDYSLRKSMATKKEIRDRLNPYSNGLLSETFNKVFRTAEGSLNPYSNGLLSEEEYAQTNSGSYTS